MRVIGRPGLALPGWSWEPAADAEWSAADLDWGPLYEPHRHPDGAALGMRLSLPQGSFRLLLETGDLPGGSVTPILEVRAERGSRPRDSPFSAHADGLQAEFAVEPEERPLDLRLRGGGPLLLQRLRLTLPGGGYLDAPEIVGTERAGLVAAKTFVTEWVSASNGSDWPFIVTTHKTDHFGRYLGDLRRAADFASVGDALVAAGLGRVTTDVVHGAAP